jgi:two-component system nitrogen regulation response regulator NtrX
MEVTAADIRGILNPPSAPSARTSPPPDVGADASPDGALTDMLDDYERRLILRVLAESEGNVAEAARRLVTDRPNLYRRMKRLGIDGLNDVDRTQPAHQ